MAQTNRKQTRRKQSRASRRRPRRAAQGQDGADVTQVQGKAETPEAEAEAGKVATPEQAEKVAPKADAKEAEPERKQDSKGEEPQAERKQDSKGEEPRAERRQAERVSSMLETSGEEVKQLLEAADDAAKKIREAAKTDLPESDASEDSDGVSSLIARTNREVQQVFESADAAAEKIREEARAEARQSIGEARRRAETVTNEHMDRVAQMTEHVLGELSRVQRQLETLRGAFDQAVKTMSANLGTEQTEVWEAQQNGAVGAEEASTSLRRRLGRRRKMIPPQEPTGISEGARLLALQQLMAGVDPDVIEERLTKEFGIDDPKPILEWMGLQAKKS